jgi:phosphopantothenoylcysteine synthetase/decarboxylase
MRLLITAGNTQAPIDRVRCITNIFTGRTGAAIAMEAARRGHHPHLLTSSPDAVGGQAGVEVTPYRTFHDLYRQMEAAVRGSSFDVVVHSAAVSDYLVEGVYSPTSTARFDPESRAWQGGPCHLVEQGTGGKVKSDEPEVWMRLRRAPKIIDQIRSPWGFSGALVKFKLEVGVTDQELLSIAERSRQHSGADLMVANCLEWAGERAYLGPHRGGYASVPRPDLPSRLLDAIEAL